MNGTQSLRRGGGNSSVSSASIARRAKLAPSQIENTINYRTWGYANTMYGFATGDSWLRSPGYYITRASFVIPNGHVNAYHVVTNTNLGAHQARYKN